MANPCDVSVVAPVYNEEQGIAHFCQRVHAVMVSLQVPFEILLVDDGSQDQSFEQMKVLKGRYPQLRLVRLARNFGHQLALTAGLRLAKGRCVVVLDSDLQDPPEVIVSFFQKWKAGYEIVHGVRKQRKGESWFKTTTAFLFYRLLCASTRIQMSKDAGDFYLLDRKVVDILNQMNERHRFIRGLLGWVGFKRAEVEYVREPRHTGQTKYSLWKMIVFSLDAATAFSFVPLRMISLFGVIISLFAFVGILLTLYIRLFTQSTITGWTSLMITVLFMGGIQLISVGIIGEYLARIGDDVKGRPLYIIQETVDI